MAKRSVSHDKVLVDPIFAIPDGAEEEFAHSREGTDPENDEEINFGDNTLDALDYIIEGDIGYDDGYDDLDEETLETPENFAIVSQTLRRAPGGQQVVDVVIETEDTANTLRYEIQVTKL